MNYYILRDDMAAKGRWFLGQFRWRNNWFFVELPPEFMEPCTYDVELMQKGTPLDLTIAEVSGGVPVLSEKAAASLQGIEDIDKPYSFVVLEPVKIDGNLQGRFL